MLGVMQLHDRNRDFSWHQPGPPYRCVTLDQARAYGEVGGFIFEDAFAAEEVERVASALDPLEEEAEDFLRSQDNGTRGIARAGEITFNPHLVARSETLRRFSKHAVFRDLARDLIGPDVRLYWDQLVYKKSGAVEEFPWHQDNGYTFVEPQQYLTCWVALTDATLENGCPWIAPGRHRCGTLVHEWTPLGFRCDVAVDEMGAEQPLPLPVKAGSIAVFSSLTPHRTGPNVSGATRKSYILQYAPDGAVMYPHRSPCVTADNEEWQYWILRNGFPV
jgi:ectoine hydroxylase-related dioxygenase (phytanoyl-CoA dioxygenase family)